MPKDIVISSNEMIYPLDIAMQEIIYAVEELLEKTQPELVTDILKNGITLTGGGSLINGMAKYLSDSINMDVILAKNTDSCVAIGTGKALDEMDEYNNYKQAFRKEK